MSFSFSSTVHACTYSHVLYRSICTRMDLNTTPLQLLLADAKKSKLTIITGNTKLILRFTLLNG